MAIEIAEAVVGALKGELAATAVNAPMVPAEVFYGIFSPLYCTVTCLCKFGMSKFSENVVKIFFLA